MTVTREPTPSDPSGPAADGGATGQMATDPAGETGSGTAVRGRRWGRTGGTARTDRISWGLAPGLPSYRPHLDGLRAVAVYLVVAFHAGIERFVGGFIGVDVFFVLSGYLVTQLLVRDLSSRGSVDLGRFYARRARRLLPAAAITLATVAVVFSAIGSPADWADARDAIRAAAVYVANWFFIDRSTDYFAADVSSNPVLHMWSLSVEEQFYLAWPLLLVGLTRVTGRIGGSRRWVQAVVAAGALGSLWFAMSLRSDALTRAYYGTDTRAYQLLAGALLALSPGVVWRLARWRRAAVACAAAGTVALVGLVVASSSLVDLDAIGRGVVATVLTLVLIASLDAYVSRPGGPAGRAASPTGTGARLAAVPGGFLSLPPLVYLGRISYATYLWHWPVLVVLDLELDLSSETKLAVAAVMATALASLSFQVVEHPVRASTWLDRRRLLSIGGGLALSGLLALVVAPRLLDPGAAEATAATSLVSQRGEAAVAGTTDAIPDWRAAKEDLAERPACTSAAIADCKVVDGKGRRMLLIGDSHARMFIPTFEELARRRDLQLYIAVQPGCGWMVDVNYGDATNKCLRVKEDWYGDVLDEIRPDVVVAIQRTVDDPANSEPIWGPDRQRVEPGTSAFTDLLREGARRSVERLRSVGAQVVIVEPIPVASDDADPLECLARDEGTAGCRFVASDGPLPEERIDRELAEEVDGVRSLDIDALACPYLPICDPVVDGQIARRDSTHLTTDYALTMLDDLDQYLTANGLIG